MQHLIDSIVTSLDTKNWYSAIAVSLTLPDICARITDGTNSTGTKYALWFDQYVAHEYKNNYAEELLESCRRRGIPETDPIFQPTKFNGNDCYALRCAYLHEGQGEIINQRARRVLDAIKFLEPSNTFNIHGSIKNNHLILHIDQFCATILRGVETWKNQLNSEQTERLKEFLLVQDIFEFVK